MLFRSLDTGRVVWQRDTAKDWDVPEPFFGVGSSPLWESGKLIVMVGGQPDAGVVALDPATGKTEVFPIPVPHQGIISITPDESLLLAPVPFPTSCRDGYAFRQHVAAARRNRSASAVA